MPSDFMLSDEYFGWCVRDHQAGPRYVCSGCGEECVPAFRCSDRRCPPFQERLALSKAAFAAAHKQGDG